MFDINNFFLQKYKRQPLFFYKFFDIFFLYFFLFKKKKFLKKKSFFKKKWYIFSIFFFKHTTVNISFFFINFSCLNLISIINLIYALLVNNKKVFIIDDNFFIETKTINKLLINPSIFFKNDWILNLDKIKLRKYKYRQMFKYFLYKHKIKFIFFFTTQKNLLWFFFFKKLHIPTGGLATTIFKKNPFDYTLYLPNTTKFHKYLLLIIFYDIIKIVFLNKQKKLINIL